MSKARNIITPCTVSGPTDAEKAAQNGVGKDADRPDKKGHAVVETEYLLEENGAGDEACGGVNREEDQDNEGAGHAQHTAAIGEPVLEIIGHRKGVAYPLRVPPEPPRDETPVEKRAGHQPDGDPDLVEPRGIDRAGKAEHQPSAHVRSASRQGGDGPAELPAAENVILEVAGEAVCGRAKREHCDQIDDDGNGGDFHYRRARHHVTADAAMAIDGSASTSQVSTVSPPIISPPRAERLHCRRSARLS